MAIDDYTGSIVTAYEVNAGPLQKQSSLKAPARRREAVAGPGVKTVAVRWEFVSKTAFQGFTTDFEAVGFWGSFDFTMPDSGVTEKYRFVNYTPDVGQVNKFAAEATLARWNGI